MKAVAMDGPTNEDKPMPDQLKRYTCNWPVKHGGKKHTASIELTDAEANPLLQLKAISQSDDQSGIASSSEGKSQEEKLALIVETAKGFDKDDSSLWTKSKVPEVKALENALGFDITAKERDAAWKIITDSEAS